MEFNIDDVKVGMDAALRRYREDFAKPKLERIHQGTGGVRELLIQTLALWPEGCERRFVRVFSEMTALAAYVRIHQEEPPLGRDDCLAALGFFAWLLNSFKHR